MAKKKGFWASLGSTASKAYSSYEKFDREGREKRIANYNERAREKRAEASYYAAEKRANKYKGSDDVFGFGGGGAYDMGGGGSFGLGGLGLGDSGSVRHRKRHSKGSGRVIIIK